MPEWLKKMLRASSSQADTKQVQFTGTVDIAARASENARPTFSIEAYSGDPMTVEAYFSPVILDLKGIKAGRSKLPILLNHDLSKVVGQADTIDIDDKGVRLSGSITGDDGDAGSVVAHAKNGFEWQASVGARIDRREFLESGKTATVNGRDVTGPLIIARQSTLVETSFVSVGADQKSSASIAAQFTGDNEMNEFKEWLKAKGIEDVDALSDEVQKTLKAAFDAELKAKEKGADTKDKQPDVKASVNASANGTPSDVRELVASAVSSALDEAQKKWHADAERRERVMAITASHPELQSKALSEGWSVEKAELEAIKASRPNVAPFVNTGAKAEGVDDAEVVKAAVCLSGGITKPEEHFDEKVLEAAHARYKGRIGLQQLLLTAAWGGGYTGHHFDKSAAGMADILKAAFSTYSISGILSNTANKFLLQGFNAVESGWRMISSTRNVSDFKQVTSYRLTGDLEFEEVGEAGEIKHGTLGDESFTNQARTYAKMLGITRQDIINDDLGALTVVPTRIGRGGALKLNTVFWTEFMDNTSFFTAARNNLETGAGSALAVDALTTAETAFFDQTDPDGQPLGIMPAVLLVPNALNVTASQLMQSTQLRDPSATSKVLTNNPHAGKFDIVRSSYLSNTNITGNSTTAWYLLASPADLPVIETVFLNGVQTPTVEQADADFNTLGIQMRGYFDFGVSKQEWRAGVKNDGA